MKEINVTVTLYRYDELEQSAKSKAFQNYIEFLDSEITDFLVGDLSVEEVEESIRINEYWFYSDGKQARTTTYTGKHEKAGLTEFYFNGNTYILNFNKELIQ